MPLSRCLCLLTHISWLSLIVLGCRSRRAGRSEGQGRGKGQLGAGALQDGDRALGTRHAREELLEQLPLMVWI